MVLNRLNVNKEKSYIAKSQVLIFSCFRSGHLLCLNSTHPPRKRQHESYFRKTSTDYTISFKLVTWQNLDKALVEAVRKLEFFDRLLFFLENYTIGFFLTFKLSSQVLKT